MEAFSRAKHWLGIITYYDKDTQKILSKETVEGPYGGICYDPDTKKILSLGDLLGGTQETSVEYYRKCLSLAVEKGLLRKLEKRTFVPNLCGFKPGFLKGKRF